MQRTTEVAPFVMSEFLIFKWELRGEGLSTGACAALPEWRARLARFAGSGQQAKKFCKSEPMPATAFYRWRKLLDQDAFTHLGFTSSRHDGGKSTMPATYCASTCTTYKRQSNQ
ncbi:MAG: IS66 family insertion sequence element accessory protein TnpA [Burkholderiaceae bacterium]